MPKRHPRLVDFPRDLDQAGGVSGLTFSQWWVWILVSVGGLFVLFLVMRVVLRAQVRARTAELLVENEELRAEIAERVGAAERLRLFQEIQTRADLMARLASLSEALNRPLTVAEVVKAVGQGAMALSGADRGAVYLRCPDDTVSCPWFQGLSPDYVEKVAAHARELPGGRMLDQPNLVIIPDVEGLPPESPLPALARAEGHRAIALWPLVYEGRVLAAVGCYYNAPHTWSQAEQEVMQAFARQAAVALENAWLFEESRRQTQELAGLYDTALAIGGMLEIEALLTSLYDQVQQLMAPDSFGVFLYHAEDDELEILLAMEAGEAVPGAMGMRLPLDESGLTGWVTRMRQPLLVNDIQTDSLPVEPKHLTRPAARSWLGVPLIARDRLIGAISVQSFRPQAFGDADRRFLESLAAQVAIAIENTRLFDETRRQAKHLEILYQASQDLATLHDLDTLLQQIVERAMQLLGGNGGGIYLYRPEQQVLEWAVAIGEEARQIGVTIGKGEGLSGRVWATGEPMIVDCYQDWPDKSPQWTRLGALAVIGVPIQWGEEFLGVLNVVADNTLRRFAAEDATLLSQFAAQAAIAIQNARLLAQVQEQARQIRQLMDTVPDGVLLLDTERRILLANPAARKHLSVLDGAGVGDALTHLGGRPIESLLEPLPEGMPHEVTVVGSPDRLFEVVARPMMEGDSQVRGWVLIIRDVTQEHEVQLRIRRQERLAAVGQLAAGIAHDFNNILTSIIGFAELARFHPDVPQSASEDLERVIQQGQRATHLVRQILDFSRKSITERRRIDLVPFLKETVKLLERTIPEDICITLEIEPSREAYILNVDLTQMQQALTNLAVNARDAMPAGGTLRFHLSRLTFAPGERLPHPEIPPGDWVVLSISDTGVGIPPEMMPHIFEPFFTTKEVGEGTGLGLAQVYGIVKQHEGYIDVESRVGEGTTFTLYLPALSQPQQATHEAMTEKIPHGQGELVLVVEDDPTVLDVAQAMLERLGYRVLTAANGRKALAVHDQHQDDIALVLTDVTMPEMGGMALSRALRAKNPQVKIVAITGYPLEAEDKEWLAQGIEAWLQKPLSFEQLAQTVSRALKT